MKVFISWSGIKSHQAAIAFRDWLPNIMQSIQPYVSSEDIDKGARWSTDIAKELEDSSFGILCVTRENLNAPWLSFEAGALSKAMDKAFVSPFLLDIKRSEVNGPILQFQSTIFQREDMKKLVVSLNKACGALGISDARLDTAFAVWYPSLESALNAIQDIPAITESVKTEGLPSELLEEILNLSRDNQKLLRSSDVQRSESLENVMIRLKHLTQREQSHTIYSESYASNKYKAMFFNDFLHTILPDFQSPYAFLIVLSFFKEDVPWLYDMGKALMDILQSDAAQKSKETAIEDFKQMLTFIFKHPFMRELYGRKKEAMGTLQELSFVVSKMLDDICAEYCVHG